MLSPVYLNVFVCSLFIGVGLSINCIHRDYGNGGTVCVCNSTYCDKVEPVTPAPNGEFLHYVSNWDGYRFHLINGNVSKDFTGVRIIVDRSERFQEIIGFGGAFTDSFGINALSVDDDFKDLILRSYFSDYGLEYNLCRVPIGGTDFSTRAYSYDDVDGDRNLSHFNLTEEDYFYKIPLIKEALEIRKNNLKLFASAWTAPPWMKTNDDYTGYGFLSEDMYQTWADYHIKFLSKYEDDGINFWGLTTGNEPINGYLPFITINSMGWSSENQSKWISENLAPTLRNSMYSSIKIMVLDDQRFFLPWLISRLFERNETKEAVDGIAIHWYWDTIVPPYLVRKTHEKFPDKFMISSEACAGSKPWDSPKVALGSWQRGESYIEDIIQDLENWVAGWVDWNMALDTKGGPTYVNNFVDSPIIVNSTAKEFYKQPMYYALGHFSKFVLPGSVRIRTSLDNDYLSAIGFERPDNGTVVVVYNKSVKTVPLSVVEDGTVINVEITPKSFNTILYW